MSDIAPDLSDLAESKKNSSDSLQGQKDELLQRLSDVLPKALNLIKTECTSDTKEQKDRWEKEVTKIQDSITDLTNNIRKFTTTESSQRLQVYVRKWEKFTEKRTDETDPFNPSTKPHSIKSDNFSVPARVRIVLMELVSEKLELNGSESEKLTNAVSEYNDEESAWRKQWMNAWNDATEEQKVILRKVDKLEQKNCRSIARQALLWLESNPSATLEKAVKHIDNARGLLKKYEISLASNIKTHWDKEEKSPPIDDPSSNDSTDLPDEGILTDIPTPPTGRFRGFSNESDS